MDTYARSHRWASWLIATLLLASVVGFIGYEVNWIRARRALVNSGAASLESLDLAFRTSRGYSTCDLAPRGRTLGQRLLVLFGEPEAPSINVGVTGGLQDSPTGDGEAWTGGQPVEDIGVVRRIRSLYPEAAVTIHFTEVRPAGSGLRDQATREQDSDR